MSLLGTVLMVLAMGIIGVAAYGVLRLPDALARQHAATKAATFGIVLLPLGLGLIALADGWGWAWGLRLCLLIVVVLLILPIVSHAVARVGLIEITLNGDDGDGSWRVRAIYPGSPQSDRNDKSAVLGARTDSAG